MRLRVTLRRGRRGAEERRGDALTPQIRGS